MIRSANLHKTVGRASLAFMQYITRVIEPTISKYVKAFPVMALTGPRQSGKSTTLRHMLPQYQYVTFDDYKTANFFAQDPDGFMDQYNNKVIFDEVQQAPQLFRHVKIAVDNDRQNYGKFVLTGSSQFAFIKKISESLAGRVGLLSMLPFQFAEVPDALKEESVFKGGYPELVLRAYANSAAWYSSYMHTYIDKDLKDLVKVGDLRDFNRLIAMLAANASRALNMSQLSVDIGVTIQTIKRWIAALEASYIIFLLPAYYKNYGKRIIKAPKIYFYDTGLVSYLTGIESQSLLENGVMAGSIFENYIVSEIYKRELARDTHADLYYLRTSNQEEVDLIVDRKTHKDLFEIKFSKSFNSMF
jgi:predicted AAA+ superfamily ATPase